MTTEQNPKKAMWLSLIPGLGQIYNKQKTKGYIFLAVTVLFLAYFLGIGVGELSKLVTLGTVRGQDNSLFILIRGAFHLIITIVYFLFYALNIKDAGTVAKRINNGIAVPKTGKEMVQAIYENGFPYLLIIPSYIAMTFAIIFPVLVTLMIAFTNYDFKHTAPTTLLDWIGFQNFTNMWTLSTFRSAFTSVLGWTLIWALAASTLQIVLGILTAIVANQPFVKGKRIFGVIFLLPWAVPAFITILTFSNMFNDSVGAINTQVLPLLSKVLPFLDGALIPWKTVYENIEYVLKDKISKDNIKEHIEKYLKMVNLLDYRDEYPQHLSGGMKRRVGIARAFVYPSNYLFMDEPFEFLDIKTKQEIIEYFKILQEKEKKTVLFITHDIESALKIGDKIIIFSSKPTKVKKIFENISDNGLEDEIRKIFL